MDTSPRKSRAWLNRPRLAAVDGIGIVMGAPSRITEIDVDAEGDAWLASAVERFPGNPRS